MTWQYCADQIGLPLNRTLVLGTLLGLCDVKSKATETKLARKAGRPNHAEARQERNRQIVELRRAGVPMRELGEKFRLSKVTLCKFARAWRSTR